MALSPGTRGIDYSGYRPKPAQVKADGAGFILRYSAGAGNADPKTAWKLCGTTEIADAIAAGLDFIANSEWYATRVTEGAAAGAADGAADLKFWQSRDLHKGATIYVSWDANPDPAHYGAVAAYLKAYRAALGGYYDVGLYGGTPAIKAMLAAKVITKGWRTNASSWSNDGLPYQPATQTAAQRAALVTQALAATPASIVQTGNYWYSKNADENIILRTPVGSHLENAPAVAPPPPVPPTVLPSTGDDLADAVYLLVYGKQCGRWNATLHPNLVKDVGRGMAAALNKLGM